MRILASVALAALAAGCTVQDDAAPAQPVIADVEDCGRVNGEMLGATEASGEWVEAAEGLPAYCEVTATLSPAEGSEIGVVYRLPAEWNGKVYGTGGGGWAGNVTLQAASEALGRGYATMQTDGGHASTDVWDNSWAANREAAKDFSYRAIHEMTVAGKKLAAAYYEQPHEKAYYVGCSTGGRMGLMEAQRFPEDYDAIVAGAPVYTLQVQTSAVLRNNTFAESGGFSPADLKLAEDAALAACDADDGLKDGLIANPRQCDWDPATIQCSGAKTDSCLSAPQVAALQTIYSGIKSPDGEWAMFPMSRGGETGWQMFVGTDGTGADPTGGGGLIGLKPLIFPEREVDFGNFSPQRDVPQVRASAFAEMYEAKDTDLSDFFAGGGKLLMWHGESDPGPSPVGSNDYARAVSQNPGAAENFRHFLAPGVGHCAGGPGADVLPLLETLEAWDANGEAPDMIVGTKRDGSLTRPHCAWPRVARHKGSGDANDPASWQCVARAS
jgi:feruloyl esterase